VLYFANSLLVNSVFPGWGQGFRVSVTVRIRDTVRFRIRVRVSVHVGVMQKPKRPTAFSRMTSTFAGAAFDAGVYDFCLENST